MKTNTFLLIAACVGLTILSGVLRGTVDQRWGMSEGMAEAAKRVEALPEILGDWVAVEISDVDPEAAKMLQCKGSTLRHYEHNRTKEVVSLILLVGPAGPLAVHTPDVCYGSTNFSISEPRRNTTIQDVKGNEHEIAVITFSENKIGNPPLRVYYAWNLKGEWVAPQSPRTAFAGQPMLYKIQLATNSLGAEDKLDAAAMFLKENLPLLEGICSVEESR